MNNFNKLYNLILESIISLNKATRAQMLANIDNSLAIQLFLNSLAEKGKVESKAADFLAKFFKSGLLTDITDKRIDQVIDILKRNTNFNIQQKITLEDFLEQNREYINRALTKEKSDDIISYIDKNIKLFRLKKEYPNGVVIYLVLLSQKGQAAVRKVIDICYGLEANPWCLASRGGDGLEDNFSKYFVGLYKSYPKHIAFQNGQLIGFCASNKPYNEWWDRLDKGTELLKLLDGKRFKPKPYEFKDIFEAYPKLTLNKETNRYDYDGSITITETFLKDGHFLIPFGVIKGRFICKDNKKLTSLFNGPTLVKGDFDCSFCENLLSLKGGPIKVGGLYSCAHCPSLLSLEGAPRYVPQGFYINNCKKLKTLLGGPEKVGDYYTCDDCSSLTSLVGAPEYTGKSFSCDRTAITTLEGSPREVNNQFSAQNCLNLVSLKGGPEKIKYELWVRGCPKLKITREDAMKYRIQRDDD